MFPITPAFADFSTNQSASVVIGQQNFTSGSENQGGSVTANTTNGPYDVSSDGTKVAVADCYNNRVLIYNSIPTSNNAPADVVVGQADFTHNAENQGGSANANTLDCPIGLVVAGTKLIVSDYYNNRVLIYNSIPTSNNASADVVIGQVDFTHGSPNQGGSVAANKFYHTWGVTYDSSTGKLLVMDNGNHRVLIYNTIPTSNNAAADVVVGQVGFTQSSSNQGGAVGANTLFYPEYAKVIGSKLVIPDNSNSRVLIYNSIPTSNNASADVVVGQVGFTQSSPNQGGTVAANTLSYPTGVASDGTKLFIGDANNYRILIFNTIPTTNSASADAVIGQADFTHNAANQGGSVAANTVEYLDGGLNWVAGKLFLADVYNNRVLIYVDPTYGVSSNSISSSSSNSSSTSAPEMPKPPGCGAQEPLGSPRIFQAKVGSRDVTLYFSPVTNNISGYVFGYGYEFDHQLRFGTTLDGNFSAGVMSQTIYDLEPNTEYFFANRAQNGCMPGNWGSVVTVKTLRKNIRGSKTLYFK